MSADPRIRFFDQQAPEWDVSGPPAEETLARLGTLEPLLDLRPGRDVLEVGCGTGQVTAWLAARVAPGRVTAVDFSPAMLGRAAQRGGAAEFVCADVCTADLGVERFDVVWCMHSFPHFSDQPAALRNLVRALRPGGALTVLHLAGWQQINAFHTHVGGPVGGDLLPPPAAWPTLLADAGLTLRELITRDDLFLLRSVRPAVAL